MSLAKVAKLAEEFQIKLAEQQYATKAPPDKKASDFNPEEQSFIESLSKQDNNKLQDVNDLEIDEKTWNRAKKAVKKYWKKYDEPWAVVFSVYKNMGGKPKKKSKKKKSELIETLIQKYGIYGHIPNVTPPQNQIMVDAKQIATKAVYNLVNSLYAEKLKDGFINNPSLENSYNQLLEFYQSLLTKGKRAKFELYDDAVSDPNDLSILEEIPEIAGPSNQKPTKLERMLTTKNEILKKHLNKANIAVRELKQETSS